jgi:peptide/nickel transport system permease protein
MWFLIIMVVILRFFVIAITLALGKGLWQVLFTVGLTMWVEVARWGQVISVKEMQYVLREHWVLGFRIIFNHILPNIMAPIIVMANFASILVKEVVVLGLGAQPPIPSWGSIIKDHYSYIILVQTYLAMVPGIAIMLITLAFMMMGNALRDALDVKVMKVCCRDPWP